MAFNTNIPGFPEINDPENFNDIVLSVDTNYLLNLLTIKEQSYKFLYDILNKFNSRNNLFITYQTAQEYYIEAENTCRKDGRFFITYQDKIKSTFETLKNLKKDYKDKVKDFDEIDKEIDKIKQNFQSYFEKKLIKPDYEKREKNIEKLFNNIGQPYSHNKLLEIMKEIEFRYSAFIAPGFDDCTKTNGNKYGDCIIWFQLMDYSKNNDKDIIFITSDKKPDWSSNHEDFRKELFLEFYNETKHNIYIYTPEDFIKFYNKLTDSKEDSKIPETSIKELFPSTPYETTFDLMRKIFNENKLRNSDIYKTWDPLLYNFNTEDTLKRQFYNDTYLYSTVKLLQQVNPEYFERYLDPVYYAKFLNQESDENIALKYLQGIYNDEEKKENEKLIGNDDKNQEKKDKNPSKKDKKDDSKNNEKE